MVLLASSSRLQPGEPHLTYSHVCRESTHSGEFFDRSVLAKLNVVMASLTACTVGCSSSSESDPFHDTAIGGIDRVVAGKCE